MRSSIQNAGCHARSTAGLLALALALTACPAPTPEGAAKSEAKADADAGDTAAPADSDAATPVATPSPEPGGLDPVLEQLLTYLPSDTLAVGYDRMSARWNPATLATVFALPPKAAIVLEERQLLDDALAQAFEPSEGGPADLAWLGPQSLAFTIPIIRHAYLVRPLLRPPSELEATFAAAGFMREEIDGKLVWLPKGAFPWRIAILDDRTAAFVPVDPGAGLSPLLDALETEPTAVEKELTEALGRDGAIELTVLAGGPMLHFDVDATIAQLQFGLRNAAPQAAYEGLVMIVPDGDVDECANGLRTRTAPEENQQVQALIKAVQWEPQSTLTPPQVLGRLAIARDQAKQFTQ
jgi:hypothetical protein